MADKENARKCFKCGASPSTDGVKLFRVLKPGIKNLVRSELWAKYLFPDRNVSSIEFQMKLFKEHRMLCSRHFKDEDFRDGASRKFLLRTAVPCDVNMEPIFIPDQPQPGPSRVPDQPQPGLAKVPDEPPPGSSRIPFNDKTNKQSNVTGIPAQTEAVSSCNKAAKTEKEKILQAKCTKYVQKICQLHKRISALTSKEMLNVIADDKNVKKLSDKITPAFALLLQGQIRNCKRKLRGRRWSKEEKITALRIYKRSPTCYRLLRRLFTLPSPGTLKTFLNRVPFSVGCNEAVLKVIKKFVKTQEPADNQYVLMFDEMSLRKHLQYEPKTDVIDGFQDHNLQGRSENVAGYALVFMIGGIRKRVKQPIAHYYSSSFSSADRLAVLIKEVLQHCAGAGVNIAATVCDMDGVNRRALSILGASIDHPYISVGNKEIVTMYDTPHLLKCFRNLFLKYDIQCPTNIISIGKTGTGVAKWSHIKQFYEIDNANPNFVFAPSLKKDHLNPNSKQKMKVNMAAQVLSHSVAAGMYAKISDGSLTTEAAVTANVVANMDKLFDALNSDSSDLRRGKPHATNMTASSPHKQLFAEMKSFFCNMKFVGSSRKPPSQEGWIWTLNAVERLWHNLTTNYKIKSLATRRLQQDALENLFGCIRGNCGSNANPTCGQFVAGLKTAVLSKLAHIGTTGNCETDNNVIINNFDTLLSALQPTSHAEIALPENVNTVIVPPTLSFEIDEGLNENTSEIQACAYVCGFVVKSLPIKDCTVCEKIFLAENVDLCHSFVESKEYNDEKKSLTYVSKDLISCVEYCASLVNINLQKNAHERNIRKMSVDILNENVDFDFIKRCAIHHEQNKNIITQSVFYICVKRFCVVKNRALSEEASASALKRKMNIITHK